MFSILKIQLQTLSEENTLKRASSQNYVNDITLHLYVKKKLVLDKHVNKSPVRMSLNLHLSVPI